MSKIKWSDMEAESIAVLGEHEAVTLRCEQWPHRPQEWSASAWAGRGAQAEAIRPFCCPAAKAPGDWVDLPRPAPVELTEIVGWWGSRAPGWPLTCRRGLTRSATCLR